MAVIPGYQAIFGTYFYPGGGEALNNITGEEREHGTVSEAHGRPAAVSRSGGLPATSTSEDTPVNDGVSEVRSTAPE